MSPRQICRDRVEEFSGSYLTRERKMEKREEPRSGNLFAMIRIFVEVQFELNVVGIGRAIVP